MTLIQKIKAWRNAPHRAPVTLKNIWAVVQSFFRRNTGIIPEYKLQQIEYRQKASSKQCVLSNMCICGCQWDELIYADKACEGGCYPDMMSAKEWKKFKKENKL